MLKRIIDSWPYVLAMVIGFVLMQLPPPTADPVEAKGYLVLCVYILAPVALLIGGVVLGFRRGFDWVTLLVCLAFYLAGMAVTGWAADGLEQLGANLTWVLFFFVLPTLIGTTVGTVVRALSKRSWVAVAVFVLAIAAVLGAVVWFLWANGGITVGE